MSDDGLKVGGTLTRCSINKRTGQPGFTHGSRVKITKLTPKFVFIGPNKFHRDTLGEVVRRTDFPAYKVWLERPVE